MGSVIALNPYRERKYERHGIGAIMVAQQPRINDGALFSRDYSTLDGMVFGVLKVREILEYHIPGDEGDWRQLLLLLLDSCQKRGPDARMRRGLIVGELKRTVSAVIDDTSRKDIANALLLMDLIVRAPQRTKPPPGPG